MSQVFNYRSCPTCGGNLNNNHECGPLTLHGVPVDKTPLQLSIEHWERMLAFTSPEQFEKEFPSDEYCALCEQYSEEYCGACPVAQSTGFRDCRETPYRKAVIIATSIAHTRGEDDWDAWRTAAQAEIDFLKSLLPK